MERNKLTDIYYIPIQTYTPEYYPGIARLFGVSGPMDLSKNRMIERLSELTEDKITLFISEEKAEDRGKIEAKKYESEQKYSYVSCAVNVYKVTIDSAHLIFDETNDCYHLKPNTKELLTLLEIKINSISSTYIISDSDRNEKSSSSCSIF